MNSLYSITQFISQLHAVCFQNQGSFDVKLRMLLTIRVEISFISTTESLGLSMTKLMPIPNRRVKLGKYNSG